jgi:hypothetical protein
MIAVVVIVVVGVVVMGMVVIVMVIVMGMKIHTPLKDADIEENLFSIPWCVKDGRLHSSPVDCHRGYVFDVDLRAVDATKVAAALHMADPV